MSALNIATRVSRLNKHISDARQRIKELQEECPHTNVTKTYEGDGGGYDYKASYWIDFVCLDCGKRWTEDQ